MATLEEAVHTFAKASLSLSREDQRQVLRVAEILKQFLRDKACSVAREAQDRPLLFLYSSDGTPLITQERRIVRLRGKSKRAMGGRGDEYLVQQGYVRFMDDSGSPKTAVLLRDPLRLTEGRAAWAVHQAAREFFPPLERLSEGLCVYVLVYDRALHTALRRLWGGELELAARAAAASEGGSKGALAPLRCVRGS
jgi:hypothetical protein